MSVASELDRRIGELTKPLKEEQRLIDRRLQEIDNEQKELRQARQRIDRVLRQLGPDSFVAKPKKAAANGSSELRELKRQTVTNYLNANAAYYVENGIIAAMVYRDMKSDKIEPVMSPSIVLDVIRDLHADGVLRAERKVRGGAMRYQFVGGGNGKA